MILGFITKQGCESLGLSLNAQFVGLSFPGTGLQVCTILHSIAYWETDKIDR